MNCWVGFFEYFRQQSAVLGFWCGPDQEICWIRWEISTAMAGNDLGARTSLGIATGMLGSC